MSLDPISSKDLHRDSFLFMSLITKLKYNGTDIMRCIVLHLQKTYIKREKSVIPKSTERDNAMMSTK